MYLVVREGSREAWESIEKIDGLQNIFRFVSNEDGSFSDAYFEVSNVSRFSEILAEVNKFAYAAECTQDEVIAKERELFTDPPVRFIVIREADRLAWDEIIKIPGVQTIIHGTDGTIYFDAYFGVAADDLAVILARMNSFCYAVECTKEEVDQRLKEFLNPEGEQEQCATLAKS